MAEALGRGIKYRRKVKGKIKRIAPSSRPSTVSHGQFVDDTSIMGQASVVEAKRFLNILSKYKKASQQPIKFDKSKLYFIHTPEARQRKIAWIFKCQIDNFLRTYLGMPMFFGASTEALWIKQLERIRGKLAGWKGITQSGWKMFIS